MNKEFDKTEIELRLDKLIAVDVMMSSIYDGLKCKKCGIVQGTAHKGVDKYYCEHLSEKIDKILNPITEELFYQTLVSTGEFI